MESLRPDTAQSLFRISPSLCWVASLIVWPAKPINDLPCFPTISPSSHPFSSRRSEIHLIVKVRGPILFFLVVPPRNSSFQIIQGEIHYSPSDALTCSRWRFIASKPCSIMLAIPGAASWGSRSAIQTTRHVLPPEFTTWAEAL